MCHESVKVFYSSLSISTDIFFFPWKNLWPVSEVFSRLFEFKNPLIYTGSLNHINSKTLLFLEPPTQGIKVFLTLCIFPRKDHKKNVCFRLWIWRNYSDNSSVIKKWIFSKICILYKLKYVFVWKLHLLYLCSVFE